MRKDNPKRVDRSGASANSEQKNMRSPAEGHKTRPSASENSTGRSAGRDGGGEGGTAGNWGGGATRGTSERESR